MRFLRTSPQRMSLSHSRPSGALDSAEIVTRDDVVALLVEAGELVQGGAARVERQSPNAERRDWPDRQHFRVFRENAPALFVTIGPELKSLWERTSQFAAECPDIACAPRFFHASTRWQIMGVEHVDGPNLEDAIARGALDPADVRRIVGTVGRSLAHTRRPSTLEAAQREFDAFAARVCDCPAFSSADRLLLAEIVLPFVRGEALRGVAETQMSNGDFVARNIIVARDGRARLIDCEFAGRTHFFAVDTWRWSAFSRVPEGARTVEIGTNLQVAPWAEAYGILQQLLLAGSIHDDDLVREEAQARLPRLAELLREQVPAFASSLVFSSLMRAGRRSVCAPPGQATAQLFWSSASGGFNETESRRITYPTRRDVTLRFLIPSVQGKLQLRLDPAEATGIARLLDVRLRCLDEQAPVAVSPTGARPLGIEFIRGLLPLQHIGSAAMLCLDEDPSLLLPSIDTGINAADVVVELLLNFDPSLESLPALLPK